MRPPSNEPPLPGTLSFKLPLDPNTFRDALRDGRGRARMHAAAFGLEGSLNAAVHATLHNLALDPQTEGERGEWMIALIESADALDAARPMLELGLRARSILAEGLGRWDRSQRCGALAALVRRGWSWARQELLAVIQNDREWTFGYALGSLQLLELDGAGGTITLAALLGEKAGDLEPNDLAQCLSRGIDHEDLLEASNAIRQALEPHSESCVGARALLAALNGTDPDDHPTKKMDRSRPDPVKDAARVIRWVESLEAGTLLPASKMRFRLRRWAGKASPEATQLLAEAWIESTEDHHRYAYAQVFGRGKVPFVHGQMIAMAESASSAVAGAARRALRYTHDPMIREAALRHLDADGLLMGWHALFNDNYEARDAGPLESALRQLLASVTTPDPARALGREDWHTVTQNCLALAKWDGRQELGPLLKASYELSPCGECRNLLAHCLHGMGHLPPWIQEEVELDAFGESEEWPWRSAPPEVRGMRLPGPIAQLWISGKWRSPGDRTVQLAVPGLQGALDFLKGPEALLRENSGLENKPTGWSKLFHEYHGHGNPDRPGLPWRDLDQSILIAVNRVPGGDLGLALDFRSSTENPRVIASFWIEHDTTAHVEWRCVAPTLTGFLAALGL